MAECGAARQDILGCNVWTSYLTVEYTPPSATIPAAADSELAQDLDRANVDMNMGIPNLPRPRLSAKMIFALTPTEVLLLPGSQEHDEPPPLEPTRLALPANSCLLLDRRTWHARAPPTARGGEAELVVTVGMAQRWMKARDAMYVEPVFRRLRCPILRQVRTPPTPPHPNRTPNTKDLRAYSRYGYMYIHSSSDGHRRTRGTSAAPASTRRSGSGCMTTASRHDTATIWAVF